MRKGISFHDHGVAALCKIEHQKWVDMDAGAINLSETYTFEVRESGSDTIRTYVTCRPEDIGDGKVRFDLNKAEIFIERKATPFDRTWGE